MLVQFSVGNFRSFKDTVTLDLVATHLESKDKSVDENNTFEAPGGLRLLKSVVLYGANASGKSNLLKALEFMKTFVNDSATESQVGDLINVEPFLLDSETEKAPSFFEIVCISYGVRYRYGFEVTNKEVVSEWLYHTPNKRESYLFTRDKQEIKVSRKFGVGRSLKKLTRDNTLFLSVAGQFNSEVSAQVLLWFLTLGIFQGNHEESYDFLSTFVSGGLSTSEKVAKESIINLVKKLDLGIGEIQLETRQHVQGEPNFLAQKDRQKKRRSSWRYVGLKNNNMEFARIKTSHKQFDRSKKPTPVLFDLETQESDGTQKVFSLSGRLAVALLEGTPIAIDEIDASLHPLITTTLIDLFQSSESNPKNTQLIFATHDVNLLRNDRFRRDQIWFVEKDKYGASHLYSLAEFKVRNDASYQKDYLQGRYGAIPFIGAQNFLEGLQNGKAPKAR
jgi:uncharacterized protein